MPSQRGPLTTKRGLNRESIIGSHFTGRAIDKTTLGKYDAILPTVEDWARVTGRNEIIIDPSDPYASGFLLS